MEFSGGQYLDRGLAGDKDFRRLTTIYVHYRKSSDVSKEKWDSFIGHLLYIHVLLP